MVRPKARNLSSTAFVHPVVYPLVIYPFLQRRNELLPVLAIQDLDLADHRKTVEHSIGYRSCVRLGLAVTVDGIERELVGHAKRRPWPLVAAHQCRHPN